MGREKVKEYARAVGETDPLYLDHEAARAAGHADVVAPPMFAVVYAAPAITAALFDPELEIDFSHLVHGAQAFTWGRSCVAGDEITTTARWPSSPGAASSRSTCSPRCRATRTTRSSPSGRWTNYVRAAT